MARLILPQFKDVPPDLGSEVTRSLDVEEIDRAFARVAKIINGGLDESNFASGLKFSIGAVGGTVQSAWAQTKGAVTLRGSVGNKAAKVAGGVTTVVLGVTGGATWTPVSVSGVVLCASTPTVTFYYGASALTAGIVATALTDAEAAAYRISDTGKTPYRFSHTAFLQTSIASGTLIKMTSNVGIFGASSVTATFTAPHQS